MALMFELPSSVADRDFAGLRDSLRRSRGVGFKFCEISERPDARELIAELDDDPSIAVTMSSLALAGK
jgi:hypothetical protein